MGKLENHQSGATTKLLFIGDSGAGKTGALASLAAAGYNLRILDLDNGLDVLANLLRDPKANYGKDALSRVTYSTITDKMKNINGKLLPTQATVWPRVCKMLDNWVDEEDGTKLGPISNWTEKDVLVIDSLTFLSKAALQYVLQLNGRLGQAAQQTDWYQAQQLIEGLLEMLYDDNVKCNVIITSHITFIGENGLETGYPSTLGKALPPKVGRYFNSTLLAKSVKAGGEVKRSIHTGSMNQIELKNTNPLSVEKSYPLSTGLADYFKAVRIVEKK